MLESLERMAELKSPSDIAREALRRLAERHMPPTPANYQACYQEIAGLPDVAPFPDAHLRELLEHLVAERIVDGATLAEADAAISRRSWLGFRDALVALLNGVSRTEKAVQTEKTGEVMLPAGFVEGLSGLVASLVLAMGSENPRLETLAKSLQESLRQSPVRFAEVERVFSELGRQLVFAAEEQAEIRSTLLTLLNLLVANIADLVTEDTWLKGQVDGLRAVIVPPLTLRHLGEMERRLREVIAKQGSAKARAQQAQDAMRAMLGAFIGRLSSMNETSQSVQLQIETSASRIEKVSRLEELAPLLKEILAATHTMTDETAAARDQLRQMQDKVAATEAELVQLHLELDNASAMARHDPLTDALNRKGLDEALAREIATVRRKDLPLSICMLDIDNFKKLNDRLGHETGDKALIHLAGVARRCMRPSDTLARYGGEEFVILMPDTSLESGVEAMVRLQRELTKAIFLSGKEKILITFSAGVAQLDLEESGSDAINRADHAMYLAKRAGKNRVIGA